MASAFPIEKLVEPPFTQRLRALLDEARRFLQLDAVAIAELATDNGSVAPVWRQWVPWSCAPSSLPLVSFEKLVRGDEIRPATTADLNALGAPFEDYPAATLVVLAVAPRLSEHADALLVALHERDKAIDQALLAELKRCLELGLSDDRRKRFSEVVFQAVEQAADPIELTDSEARLLYANRAWEQTFGYSARESVGQTVGQLFRDPVTPLHDSAFYQFTLATLANGRAWSGALACRSHDGTRVFVEPMVSPFVAAEQGFTGNFAVRRNLAQRAQRDTALATAHHEFRAVLSAIPDGVAVLRDGKIYFVNAAFLSMVRRSEESVIGLAYADLVHPDDRDVFVAASETDVTRVRILRDIGSPRFAEISIAGSVSFEGRPAIILLSRDVTEHRIAEEQLAHAERLSALGSLAAGVAHEINNPLAYVSLNLAFVQRANALHGTTLQALVEAIDGTKRIQQIVTELRAYTGSDAPAAPEAVDVAKAVTSATNIAQNVIRHRARLARSVEDRLYVLAREGPLVQVLVNLLVNAAHAIPESGGSNHSIAVSAEAVSESHVAIEISDTGVGIAPQLLPHVFDAFSTTKKRGEGSGLGLAISKRIIEDLGGRISIRSLLGAGTTVRVELPRATRTRMISDIVPAPNRERSALDARKTRVLIVDDEVTLAETLHRVLPQYDITVAFNAHDALDELRVGDDFDVILCDLMMPGVTGPEFYRDACVLNPQLRSRFAFMTGGAFTEWGRVFLERTRCPTLTKPFGIDVACRVVDQIVLQNSQCQAHCSF